MHDVTNSNEQAWMIDSRICLFLTQPKRYNKQVHNPFTTRQSNNKQPIFSILVSHDAHFFCFAFWWWFENSMPYIYSRKKNMWKCKTVFYCWSLFSVNQNQPALEKDRYKIRQAFIAEPGNSLIVADYGQVIYSTFDHYHPPFNFIRNLAVGTGKIQLRKKEFGLSLPPPLHFFVWFGGLL